MKIKIWYLLLSAIFYFTFTIQGVEFVSYLLFYGIPLLCICLNTKYVKRIINIIARSSLKYFCLFYIVLMMISLVIPVLYQTHDFSYFSNQTMAFPKELLRVLFLLIIFLKYVSPVGDFKLFIKYYLLSCCLYIGFTCILLVFPDLKMVLYAIIKEPEHSKVVALQADYVTRYGWSGFSGFEHTLKCTWGILLCLFLIIEDIKKKNWSLYLICGILLIGNLFYGRSGFLISIVILLIFMLILLKKHTKIFLFLVVAMASIFIVMGVVALINQQVRIWFEWAFALFINFFKEGRIGTVSTDILINNMYFLPEIKTMLVGDGKYIIDSLYYMNTDVGILRTILFGGIFFLLVRYLLMFTILYGFLHSKEINNGISRWFVLIAFIITLILFELKGEIVFASISILFGIVVLMYYNKSIDKIAEDK